MILDFEGLIEKHRKFRTTLKNDEKGEQRGNAIIALQFFCQIKNEISNLWIHLNINHAKFSFKIIDRTLSKLKPKHVKEGGQVVLEKVACNVVEVKKAIV